MTPRSERYLAGEAASGPADSFTVRAVAVGNRISVRAARTERSFVAELERIVGMAAPHLSAEGPNLLVLAELLGLPAALCGLRAWPARQARTSESALTLLALAYLPRVLRARRRWKGISLARALLLARADALYHPFVEALSRPSRGSRSNAARTHLPQFPQPVSGNFAYPANPGYFGPGGSLSVTGVT